MHKKNNESEIIEKCIWNSFVCIFVALFFVALFTSKVHAREFFYWTSGASGFVGTGVHSAELDGSNVQPIVDTAVLFGVSSLNFPRGIAIDEVNGKVYWAESKRLLIMRANLDGSNPEMVADMSLLYPLDRSALEDLAIDPYHQKIFWAINGKGRTISAVGSMDLDGSNLVTLVPFAGLQRVALSIDRVREKVYMANEGFLINGSDNVIQVMDYDGSNLRDIVSGFSPDSRLAEIAVDPFNMLVFWTDFSEGKIQSANFDGSNVTDVVTGLTSIGGMDIDPFDSYLYWVDVNGDIIWRSELDGTLAVPLVATNPRPQSLTLDIAYPDFRDVIPLVQLGKEKENSLGSEFADVINDILSDPTIPDEIADVIENAMENAIGNNWGKGKNGASDKLLNNDPVPAMNMMKQIIIDLETVEADYGYDTTDLQALVADYGQRTFLWVYFSTIETLGWSHPDVVASRDEYELGGELFDAGDYAGALQKYRDALFILPPWKG